MNINDIDIRPFKRDTLSVRALSSSLKIILAKTVVFHSKQKEKGSPQNTIGLSKKNLDLRFRCKMIVTAVVGNDNI